MNDARSRAFGAQVRAWRAGLGWSQQDLADRMDVRRATVSTWEVGESAPNPKQEHRLRELMGADYPALDASQPESVAVVLNEAETALVLWWRQYAARLLAASRGEAPPLPDPRLQPSDDGPERAAISPSAPVPAPRPTPPPDAPAPTAPRARRRR